MSSSKFAKFVIDKLGITKPKPTVKELFQNKLGLSDNVSGQQGIGAFADEDLGSMIKFTSKRADTETINAKKLFENFYNTNVTKEGLVKTPKGENTLINISKAFNTTKLIDEGALPIQIKNNILGKKLDVNKTPRLVSQIEPYLDNDKSEVLKTIALGLGREKANRKVLLNVIQKEFPANNAFTSVKKFEEAFPTERLKTDFIISKKPEIDELLTAYGLPLKSSELLSKSAQNIKSMFDVNQRRQLMTERGKTLSKVQAGEIEAKGQGYGKERTKIMAAYAPETVTSFLRSGPEKLFEARFRNLLEGKKFAGYNENLERVLTPVSGFTKQHRTQLAVAKAFKKYGMPNEVVEAFGYKNIMILPNPSNMVLSKYENQATTLIKQAVRDDMKLRKIILQNQFGYATSKELDQIPKLNENLLKTRNKISEIKNSLPEDLQLAFNPITVQLNNGIKFKPIQSFINDFVGTDVATAKATGLVKGLARLGVPEKTIKKAYDKAYLDVLNEVKAGKFAQSYPETMVVPFEKIKYKLKRGGIVDLIRKIN